ncbi:MAG: PAC2 family protein [Promethearchaeota archaeon]
MHVEIREEMEINAEDLNNPIILIGFPGIALVAKLALTSIKDFLKAKLFLTINCFDFPATSNVNKGTLEIPTAKVYYVSQATQDLFFLTSDYQPQSSEGVFHFCKTFCEKMDELTKGKIQMYLSMGALVSENVKDPPMIHACGTNKEILLPFTEHENTTILEKGQISGANGILPAYAGANNFAPGVCLLAETLPLPMMSLDPRASKALVTLLDRYFNLNMNYDELDKKIEEMQGIIDSFKKQAEQFMRRRGGEKKEGPEDSYFR